MTMITGNTLAGVARLIGDPARANILTALMDGRALTAGELARHAGVSPQTTSGHLARLAEAQLIAVERQGRHRYHRLASAEVARAMESLMTLAASGPPRHRPPGPRDEAMRAARTCYDHLAGRLGTGLLEAFLDRGFVTVADAPDRRGAVTDTGRRFFAEELGIEVEAAGSRPACRGCLDWSERRLHVAGPLGAALCRRALELGWIERMEGSRAVAVTARGRRGFRDVVGLSV